MYTTAPLPFQGQKRRRVKEFAGIITATKPTTVVDLFGGSGLLSHVAKRTHPNSRVVYNDYNNYSARLANVERTNALLDELRTLLAKYPREAKIIGKAREAVLKRLRAENKRGFVDWITISSSLLFSMNYATDLGDFEKGTLYNKVCSSYNTAGYLDGLEVVRMDYRDLFNAHKDLSGVLFVVDPPYLSTDTATCGSGKYWKLKDYLDVLTILKGVNYVYFTSDKSQIVELCEWLDKNVDNVQSIFKGASVKTVHTNAHHNAAYTDIMLYKLNAV